MVRSGPYAHLLSTAETRGVENEFDEAPSQCHGVDLSHLLKAGDVKQRQVSLLADRILLRVVGRIVSRPIELDSEHRVLILVRQHEVEMRLQCVGAEIASVEFADVHDVRYAHFLMKFSAMKLDNYTDLQLNPILADVSKPA